MVTCNYSSSSAGQICICFFAKGINGSFICLTSGNQKDESVSSFGYVLCTCADVGSDLLSNTNESNRVSILFFRY